MTIEVFNAWAPRYFLSIVVILALSACDNNTANKMLDEQHYQLLQMTQRNQFDENLLNQTLQSKHLATQQAALRALVQLANHDAANKAQGFLHHEQVSLRELAALALGASRDERWVPSLRDQFEREQSAAAAHQQMLALGQIGGANAFQFINQVLTSDHSLAQRSSAAQALGILLTWTDTRALELSTIAVDDLLSLAQTSGPESIAAAFALSRITQSINGYQESSLTSAIKNALNPQAQALLIRAWSRFTHRQDYAAMLPLLRHTETAVLIESARALTPFVANPKVAKALLAVYQSADEIVQGEVLTSLLSSKDKRVVAPLIYPALLNENVWQTGIALDWLAQQRPQEALAAALKVNAKAPRWLQVKALQIVSQTDPAKLKSQLSELQVAAHDPIYRYFIEPKTSEASAEQVKRRPLPTLAELQLAQGARIRLTTVRGDIILQLAPQAPVNAAHLYALVTQQKIVGSVFSRVIANFVAQGGDTLGNGMGQVDYQLRDEWSLLGHRAGTVGIASRGKDTLGVQFFINLADNLHLDGRYTVVAQVVSGMDVAAQLQMGDAVLAAEVIQ